MKRSLLSLAIICALLTGITAGVAAQSKKYGVTATPAKGVDFAALKTYTWVLAQPSPDKNVHQQITTAIDRELASLGMTKAASGTGDVVVAYAAVRRTDVNLKGDANANGAFPEVPVGTLLVVLRDPKSQKELLRLRTDQPIDLKANTETTVNAAVTELFTKYPTRTAVKK